MAQGSAGLLERTGARKSSALEAPVGSSALRQPAQFESSK